MNGDVPLLSSLTCSNCGTDLDGGGSALVYVCRNCLRAKYMKRPEPVYAFRYVEPVLDLKGPVAYAPFWRCTGKLKLKADEPKKLRSYRTMKPLGALFFPAFWNIRLSYFDNLTLRYALLEAGTIRFGDSLDAPLLDGIRDPAVVSEMARLTWLAYLDRRSDVTGVDAGFDLQSLAYCAVPFYREGDSYVDGVCGVRLPGVFFSEGRAE